MAKVYWIDKDALAISDLASDNKTLSGPTAGTISLHCSRMDYPFVDVDNGATVTLPDDSTLRVENGMLESPTIPAEFHEALCYKAIAHGYEKTADGLQQAQYFEQKWQQALIDGKKEANNHKQEQGSMVIVGRDF